MVFEKESVNTLDGTGEILLAILSSLAQEESRNISENTRWGVVRRFEKGQVIVNHNKFMGYTKNDKGELVIVPEEAEVVRLIFRLYLEGYSTAKISEYLEEKGIKTATGKDKWNAKKIVWRCSNRLTNGVEQCSDSETLEEGALNRAVMEAIHRITRNEGDFVGAFRQNVIRVIGSYGREQQSDEYSDQIKAKQEEMVALIAENAKVGDYTQEFDEQYRKIAEEISALKEEQAESVRKKKLAENYEQRVKDMDAFISASTCQIPEFDNDLVRRLIAGIRVISADRIEIQFQSGIVMEQEIAYE